MATAHRYVSTNHGDDGNTGLSPDQAWATLDHAASQDYSGNADGTDIHIAPGTYRETVVTDYPGTASAVVRFLGDPECLCFPDENPGRVRVTGCDAGEHPQSVTVITCNKAYVEWHRLHLDGGSIGLYSSLQTGVRAVDCMVQPMTNRGFRQVYEVVRCVGFGFNCGIEAYRVLNSWGCARWTGVAIAGSGLAANSVAMAEYTGFGGTGAHFWNSIALGESYGFSTGTPHHCLAVMCDSPYTGSQTPDHCYQLACNTPGSWPLATQLGLAFESLSELTPWLALNATGGLLRQGDNSGPAFSAFDTDLSGHRLRLKGSALDIGPWSVSEPSDQPPNGGMLDWAVYHTEPPAIRVEAQGDVLFHAPAQAARQITVCVWVRHDGLTGDKPQLLLRGDSIPEQTATCTSADATWQQLSVSATPTADEVLAVILRARNTAGTCRFSDLATA